MKKNTLKMLLVTTSTILLTACGGGGGGDSTPAATTVTGTFVDDPVQGLDYNCSSGTTGITNEKGEYTCKVGDNITFMVNSVTIGTIAAQTTSITPYLLFPNNNTAALNLARLLQSIDTKAVTDIIELNSTLEALIPANIDFTNASFETSIETALSITLISDYDAQQAMNSAITTVGGSIPSDLNHIPVANAGIDRAVDNNVSINLNGSSSSDGDSDPLTYSWSVIQTPIDGNISIASFDNNISIGVNPSMRFTMDGTYILSLTVNDGNVSSASDTVTITVSTPNSVPVANAGVDQNIITTSTVTLDGNNSTDENNESLTYNWSFTIKPNTSNATLTNPTTVNPTFVADLAGNYTIQLIVSDGNDNSIADTISVTATTDTIPTSNAGVDQKVYSLDNVTLNASGSSDDGSIVSYDWKEGLTVLSTSSSFVKSDFTVGTHTVTLTVTDDIGQTKTDTVVITIFDSFVNLLPMAENGGVKIISSSTINGTTTTTLSSGSSSFFSITNDTTREFTMTKFEIVSTYNGTNTIRVSSSNIAGVLGNDKLSAAETVVLGHSLTTSETANYWTGRYYLTDDITGQTFTNEITWNGTVFN